MDAATSKSILFFVISEIILNFATEFIHHSKEGNRRTLGQDALRPLLFYKTEGNLRSYSFSILLRFLSFPSSL